ncbi:hypothetical protein GCM10022216_33560 [Sphingobacterium kyonggiense]|uniref:FecR protein domain-containing protein n=1 Tax=Sphingobacterium kyonggiense TaxID=714075 RepID=A0ABP7Z542_9SPHI
MNPNEHKQDHLKYLQLKLSETELSKYIEQVADGYYDENFPLFDEMESTYSQIVPKKTFMARLSNNLWMKIAALLFVFISLATIIYSYYQHQRNNSLSLEWISYESPMQKRAVINLIDGSIVTLTPGTQIRYPKTFSGKYREVFIDNGKAYFEVAKNQDKPFIVHLSDMNTKVLGTKFTIEHYKAKKYEKINLYEGAVQIENSFKKTETILKPGQFYEWNAKLNRVHLGEFNIEGNPTNAESMTFSQSSLELVLNRLEFLQQIIIDTEGIDLVNMEISGNFDGMNTKQILDAISIIHPYRFIKTTEKSYKMIKK